MGRPPAYIFVVRHGHRLDAADKQWHLTSPAPYDPPLTYNGWQQARALGAKISSILRERILDEEAAAAQNPDSCSKRRHRKYKIILHSSPFLRCVQTSIGVSAGIAQDPAPLQTTTANGRIPTNGSSPSVYGSNGGKKTDGEASSLDNKGTKSVRLHETRKTVLRLDAFLGEWLTPGYFELITPPPESVMMLATAKADLLRPEDHQTSFPAFPSHLHSSSQGQLWGGSGSPISASPAQSDGLDNFPRLSEGLTRSSSISSQHGRPSTSQGEPGGYVAPVPHYAISSSANIPVGYVAHARDACVNIDYQWDSMRGPLEWGDGGKFGEEWTDMHRRFRNGIQRLVDWYASAENPTEMVTKTARWTSKEASNSADCAVEDDPEEDDETEAIVILVSHGAGCNALIGALTHQPVLTDVGMASLTMAVRKPWEEISSLETAHSVHHSHKSHNRGKGLIEIHNYYDLQILASTEHLRSNSQSSGRGLARTPSTNATPTSTRGRFPTPVSSQLSNFSYNDLNGSRSSSANAIMSNSRRPSGNSSSAEHRGIWLGTRNGITVGSGVTSFSARNPSSGLSRTPSIGLWSPLPRDEDEDEEFDSMLLNFSHERLEDPVEEAKSPTMTLTSPTNTSLPITDGDGVKANGDGLKEKGDAIKQDGHTPYGATSSSTEVFSSNQADGLPKSELAVSSLWGGGPRPPGEAERIRDLSSSKRRWTVNEMET